MMFTALVTLEINMHFQKGVSISYAAETFLGKNGKILSTFTIGFLFYALLAAYMAGGASILQQILLSLFGIELNHALIVLLFACVFGGIISARAKAVDITNRIFVFMMALCFIALIAGLTPHVNMKFLCYQPTTVCNHFSLLVPLFFTSFGFHGSIPTIVNYVGPDPKKLRFVFFVGSFIPLAVYLIWEVLTLGTLPFDSSCSDVGVFVHEMSRIVSWGAFPLIIEGFTFLAIVTSFLGVGIGLFDFIEEHTKLARKPLISFTTFALPLLFALFYPNGFIIALSYAAIALSILAVIIPTLIVLKMRTMDLKTIYKVVGGRWALIFVLFMGFLIIVLDILHML